LKAVDLEGKGFCTMQSPQLQSATWWHAESTLDFAMNLISEATAMHLICVGIFHDDDDDDDSGIFHDVDKHLILCCRNF